MKYDDLPDLKPGWLKRDSQPPTQAALAVAAAFKGDPRVKFYPVANGGIQLEWGKYEDEGPVIEINPDGRVFRW